MNTEITLAVSELKEALPGLTKVIGKSRTLPVLQSVRIARNREGLVTLHATDLDSFLTYKIKAGQQGSPVEVLVPVDQLTKATKCSAPNQDIGIVPEAKDKVKLRYNIAGNVVEQTISTLPVDEYPAAPCIRQSGVQLEPQFGQALKEALACCSEDTSRYVLHGACLDVNEKKFHYVVGTNGRALFSANSFCFDLQKSVIIPDSKFLSRSDFLEEEPAFLSVEPGKEAQEAKNGKPAQEGEAGWVKLESPRWTFVTREIYGKFPDWKQCVPTPDGKWTQVMLSEEAIAQLLLVIPNLPGADSLNCTIRLRVNHILAVEAQNRDDEQWTSIPVQGVNITGNPVNIALNREYLLKALRFGLNKLEIQDPLTPMVLSNSGKKMVIMPLRLDADGVRANSAADKTKPADTKTPSEQPQTPAKPEPTTEERTEMPRTAKTPEAIKPEAVTRESQIAEVQDNGHSTNNGNNGNNGNGTSVKCLTDHVDHIKDSLKNVIRQLSDMADALKQAEKEKRVTEKEIEAVRTKLRQIQNVTL